MIWWILYGAPMRAEDLCGDYVWLLENNPGKIVPDSMNYDDYTFSYFREYMQSGSMLVVDWDRVAGETDSATGSFRIRLDAEAVSPPGQRAFYPACKRTGLQDWVSILKTSHTTLQGL